MISHWDDVPSRPPRARAHRRATGRALTGDASEWVGVQRIRVDPGKWATPLHLEGSEEEIFFVLAGSGRLRAVGRLGRGGVRGRARATVSSTSRSSTPTRSRAGPTGSTSSRSASGTTPRTPCCPRAGVSWLGPTWVLEGAPDDHPWKREAAAGPPEVGELAERPSRIVNVEDVRAGCAATATTVAREVRDLGRAAGSIKTGLRLFDVRPGMLLNPPHCHSAEEEIFVVLDGEGTLELWPHLRFGGEHEEHAVRAGQRRRASGGNGPSAHLPRGRRRASRVLAYGTRDPRDVTYYPRSGKVNIRGLGLIGRLDVLDYWDGED